MPIHRKPQMLRMGNGEITPVGEGCEVTTLRQAYCETSAQPISVPQGETVEVNHIQSGVFGVYCNITFEGTRYNLNPRFLKVER